MNIRTQATQAVTQLLSLNVLMWLTMLTCFAGVLFCAAAIYLAVAAVLAPALAALIAGVALLLLFGLQVVLVRWATRPQSPDKGEDKEPPADTPADNTPARIPETMSGKGLADWSRNNADIATAGALVAGVALAVSPGLRHFVVRAAGPLVVRKCTRVLRDFTQ